MQKGLSIFDLPEFSRINGFEGSEISDREIFHFDDNFLQRLFQKCFRSNCGLILDVNTGLSYSNGNLRNQEVQHVRQMIHIANKLDVNLLRICLGNQFIRIQKYIKKRQKLTITDKSSAPFAKPISKFSSKSHSLGYITRFWNEGR